MTEIHKVIGPDGKVTITEITKEKQHGLIWNMVKLIFWVWVLIVCVSLLLA